MRLTKRVARGLLRRLLPQPVAARHAEYSMIFSADDDPGRPTRALLELAQDAIRRAPDVSMAELSGRMPGPPRFPDVWPGEVYKLLAALVQVLRPAVILDIGTGGGTSALAMQPALPTGGRLVTFDVIGWRDYAGTLLRAEDFQGERLVQYTDDVTRPEGFAKHLKLFEAAQLIYIDAAKDGVMEQRLLDLLGTVPFRAAPLLVFDDIRLWPMLRIWRAITHPKLDLTSFGHWTGTGLVEWPSA